MHAMTLLLLQGHERDLSPLLLGTREREEWGETLEREVQKSEGDRNSKIREIDKRREREIRKEIN